MIKKGDDCIHLLYLYLFESTNFQFDMKVNFTSNFFDVVWWFYFSFTTITPQQQSHELDGLKINISSYSGVFSISEAAILLILHYESNGIFNFLSFYGEVFCMTNSLVNFWMTTICRFIYKEIGTPASRRRIRHYCYIIVLLK